MCPHCRAFISSDDRVCPYCNEKVGAPAIAQRKAARLSSAVPDATPMSLLFLLVNAALFIACVVLSMNNGNSNAIMSIDVRTSILMGAKWRPEMLNAGQWWRLITAGFLHGGAMHIFMNGINLYQMGHHFEDYLGSARFIAVYVVSTITGFGLSLLMNPNSPSVGASAALMGILGALYAASQEPGSPISLNRKTYYFWMVGFLLFGFLSNFTSQFRTDNAAHIGGLAGGYLFIKLAGLPGPTRSARETLWRSVAVALVALTLWSFWKMYLFFSATWATDAYRIRF